MVNMSLPKIDAERLARMVEISRVLNSTTNLDKLLDDIIKEAATLTDAEAASILLLDPQTRQLHFKATSNEMAPGMQDTPVPLDNSIAGTVLRRNRPMIVRDVSRDARWNPQIDKVISFQTDSILAVPMHDVERPVGVLEALNKQNGEFTEEDMETLSILADIAGVAVEKARLISQLQQAYDELNELDQVKSDFIAVASHELRTPLSVILGYVSFLREEAGPSMAQHLDSVLEAAVQLRSLIRDMLNFQYVDAGNSTLQLKRVDLGELVRDLTVQSDETTVARQQTVATTVPPEPLLVRVDRNMIETAVGNVLNNAIKFTPDGGHIEIELARQGDEAWLRVSDTGIGIPPDKLERIFKRFYQVERSLNRRHEGLGLGLSIARELVELHDGRIWAESDGTSGSTFYIALPLFEG